MINKDYKYSELTSQIIGCAIEVHKSLGNGFQEVIYQRALSLEMEEDGLLFERDWRCRFHIVDNELVHDELIFW